MGMYYIVNLTTKKLICKTAFVEDTVLKGFQKQYHNDKIVTMSETDYLSWEKNSKTKRTKKSVCPFSEMHTCEFCRYYHNYGCKLENPNR